MPELPGSVQPMNIQNFVLGQKQNMNLEGSYKYKTAFSWNKRTCPSAFS